MLHFIVKAVAKQAVIGAALVANELLNQHNEKLKNENPDHIHLYVKQRLYSLKESYYIYNENGEKKYKVKNDISSIKPYFHIYDMKGREIGAVKEKLLSFKTPFSLESKPQIFIIEKGGNKVGEIRLSYRLAKKNIEIDFNNWKFENNFLRTNYKVVDGYEEIMNIHAVFEGHGNQYTINFAKPENEIDGLLLFIALGIIAERAG